MLDAPPPAALVDWLADRTRGNPLDATGLLHALVEEGADLEHPAPRRRAMGRLGEAAGHFVRSAVPGDDEAVTVLRDAVHAAEQAGAFEEALKGPIDPVALDPEITDALERLGVPDERVGVVDRLPRPSSGKLVRFVPLARDDHTVPAPPPITGTSPELQMHDRSRYRAAAGHARRLYPGPLGELQHQLPLQHRRVDPRLAATVLATRSDHDRG